MDYRELLRSVRKRPGMYLVSELTYREIVAFVEGLSHGRPGLLVGFREFLILKLGDGDNLAWPSLVTRLAESKEDDREAVADQQLVDALFNLLDEFLAETRGVGASAIAREHLLWQQNQSWYNVDLLRFSSSPAPEQFALPDAAIKLGIDLGTIYDLMAEGKVSPSRKGSTLYLSERQIEALRAHL